MSKSVLLIDDDQAVIDELSTGLSSSLTHSGVEIRHWVPREQDGNPLEVFESKIDPDTILVVTDYDLTGNGHTGLFGATIVEWCHKRTIPVGNYSRANPLQPHEEPSLFEIRIPRDTSQATSYISRIVSGFVEIKEAIESDTSLLLAGSPAAVLARILGEETLEPELSLYGLRMGSHNAALMQKLINAEDDNTDADPTEMKLLLGYLIGHILLNSVLRFPGPILSTQSLAAYMGIAYSDVGLILKLFVDAEYGGPFSKESEYYWLWYVDDVLEPLIDKLPADTEYETFGELNRLALNFTLGKELKTHDCTRCGGQNGGYICPITKATVCDRSDCSVGSNSWIPAGARICRIEKEFYDEWAPILGI